MFIEASLGSLGRGLVIAAFTAVVGSLLAWLIGTRVTYRSDERKRRRENDLAARNSFYENYGEFFATWKLWDAAKVHAKTASPPGDVCWTLLARACNAEGGFESLLVKIASERMLSSRDKLLLACFRESYQQLREAIRKNQLLDWRATGTDVGGRKYRAFKALAEYVAFLLEHGGSPRRRLGQSTVGAEIAGRWAKVAHRVSADANRRPQVTEQAQQDAITNLLSVTSVKFRKNWWEFVETTLMADQAAGGVSAALEHEGSSEELTPVSGAPV